MVKVGIVGFGFMGRMHYRVYKSIANVEIAAICDTNPNIVKDTEKAIGNIAGAEESVDFDSLKLYSDFDKMLLEGGLDAVSIALPTHLHTDFAIKALDAGLHVLCEKPMALNEEQCNQMTAAAQSSGKILQIGHCVRFWPEYAKAKEIVDSAKYGRVIAAMFQRLGSTPTWSDDNWFLDEQRSGGMVLDLHIHDTDYIQYLLGKPRAVHSFGAESPAGGLAHVVTEYLYDDDKVITAEGGWMMAPSFGFEMSFNIMLEKATIVYDCTRQPAFKVCPMEGEVLTPQVAQGDGYSRQAEHFIDSIQGKQLPEVITLEQSCDSVIITNAEKESIKQGCAVNLR